jgi:dipeptidyl aminopeptidase/acylaminoacyl peptidase
MNTRPAILLALFFSAIASLGQGRAESPTIKPTDNLVTEGLPEIPASLVEQVRRYTESRSASFFDWHPSRREMLIGTRFANSNQVHWIKQPGGARTQWTFFAEPVASATFEPKEGRYFVFSRDTGGNEFGQLYRMDTVSGNVELLTDGGRSQNSAIRWNRRKDRLVYASTRRNGADRDLRMMDPAIGSSSDRLVMENAGGGWSPLDWSPDDQQLLVGEYLSINKSNLYLLNLSDGTRRLLTTEDRMIAYGGGQFSSDGKGIFMTSDRDGEFMQLGYMELATGKVEPLIENLRWGVESFEVSPDGNSLALVVNQGGVSRCYVYDVPSKKLRMVEGLPQGVMNLGTWHDHSQEFGLSISSARSTSDVYSVESGSGQVTRWTESELGGLQAAQLSEPNLIRWKSFDGLEITGFHYAPPSRFAGKRPVIINIHGGPEGQSRPIFQGRNNYFINEMGIAMIFPNVRGSDGYGKTFLKLDNGLKRLDSVKDIGALLDWIAQQPELDATRIMVTGGSYGGYMTLACAVEYNDRLRCALDVVGISHFATFLKNTESYRRDLRRVEYGDERDREIARFFDRMAPLNNASKITKPLFVVQGGNDPRVPVSEAEQMVAKVKANGGPIWYLMAKDEGHGFRKKNNADFQFYATVTFVQKHLLD